MQDIVDTIEKLRASLKDETDPRVIIDTINTIDLLVNSLLTELKKAG
jgi:hypothetical protein